MHIRITRGMVDPARIDELVTLLDDVVAAYRQLPGFQTYTGGIDRSTGRVVAMSVWDGADAADFPRERLGAILARVLDLGVQLEPAEIYEIVGTA